MKIPRLLAISDETAEPGAAWKAWCAEVTAAGIDAIQIRNKAVSDRTVLRMVLEALESTGRSEGVAHVGSELDRPLEIEVQASVRVLVNRRFDLALASRADGVQLPAQGLSPFTVRRHLEARGRDWLLIGRSTHDLEEVRRAADEGADFVTFGPVFETPSKIGKLEARGLRGLEAAAAVGVPVLALGGIGPENAAHVLASGAWGFAAIRWFASALGVRQAVQTLSLSGTRA